MARSIKKVMENESHLRCDSSWREEEGKKCSVLGPINRVADSSDRFFRRGGNLRAVNAGLGLKKRLHRDVGVSQMSVPRTSGEEQKKGSIITIKEALT